MASGSGNGNNESHNDDPFVVVENDTPPNMDARMNMLTEQMAKTKENIAMIMARQGPRHGQPNAGTQVIFQSKDKDPNALYDKFRNKGVTEFYGNEDAIKADEWLELAMCLKLLYVTTSNK